jgi:hypothetical protein
VRRRLFNLLAGMSLVLCVASAVAWAFGSRREPGIRGVYLSSANVYAQLSTHNHIFSVDVAAGQHWPQIRATHFPMFASGFGLVRRGEWGAKLGDPLPLNMAFTGVSLDGFIGSGPVARVRVVTVAADHWLAILVLGTSAWLFRKMANPRRRPGLCPACGYDLRATPERCPECGAVAATPAGRSGGPAGGGPVRTG